MFQAKVGGTFAALSTAEEVLGRKIQTWVTNKVLDLCHQRRQLKQQKYTYTEEGLEYRKLNRAVRKEMKTTKEEWIEKHCKNIEKEMMSGNSKKAYKILSPRPNSISQQSSETQLETS